MEDADQSVKPALKLIKGYACGNRITREDLMAVLYLARGIAARDMFKILVNKGLVDLVKGDPRFSGKEDEYQISQKGLKLTGEE